MVNDVLNAEELFGLEETVEETVEFANANKVGATGIWKFFPKEVETPYYFHSLIPLNKALPGYFHYVKGMGEVMCKKSPLLSGKKYPNDTECSYCKLPDAFDSTNKEKNNRAASALVLLGYFYDAVGNIVTVLDANGNPKKGEDGEPLILEDEPVKVLLLKRGKEDVNITTLKDLDRGGELMETLFEVKKFPKSAKRPMIVSLAHEKTANKRFAEVLPDGCKVPAEAFERFDNFSKEERVNLI